MSYELNKQLNHHTVRQMLSDHIPDDEAKLLNNGRLTCMICQHRPIFDCVKTLSVHRTGKKHITELGTYLKCLSDHDYHKLKLKQQNELKSKVTIKSDISKQKYMKRKLTLSTSILLRYKPEGGSGTTDFPKIDRLDYVHASTATQVRNYLKSIKRKKGFEESLEHAKDSYGVTTSPQNYGKNTNAVSKSKASVSQNQYSSTVPSNYDKSKAEHELKLKMSGWLKDSTGKWVKNPNVEFDSDEDKPPSPNY